MQAEPTGAVDAGGKDDKAKRSYEDILDGKLARILKEYKCNAQDFGFHPTCKGLLLPAYKTFPDPAYKFVSADLRIYTDRNRRPYLTADGEELSALEFEDEKFLSPSLVLKPVGADHAQQLKEETESDYDAGLRERRRQCALYGNHMEVLAQTLQRNLGRKSKAEEEKEAKGRATLAGALADEAKSKEKLQKMSLRQASSEAMSESLERAAEQGSGAMLPSSAVKSASSSSSLELEEARELSTILGKIIDRIHALSFGEHKINPFRQRLDDTFHAAFPTYKDVIEFPVDLHKMREKNKNQEYTLDFKNLYMFKSFKLDLQLMSTNAQKFNEKGNPVHEAALELAREAGIIWDEFGKDIRKVKADYKKKRKLKRKR